MLVPKVRLVPFEEVADTVGGNEKIILAIFLRVEGETSGNMFFLLSLESAKRMLQSIAGIEVEDSEHFSEMELSALNEIGNILAGSFLTSLADFTKLSMSPTVPALAIDMAGAIVSYGLLEYGQMGDRAMLIDTKFLNGQDTIEGQFYFIPDPQSFDTIFSALGVPPK
jgi:chemotaxis protein CheC